MASRDDEEILKRLRKLSEQLDAAKKSAEATTKQVQRVKDRLERAWKGSRVFETSEPAPPRGRRRRKKS